MIPTGAIGSLGHRYQWQVLEVCQALHGVTTGSLEDDHGFDDRYEWLITRYTGWVQGHKRSDFDLIVYDLVRQVINEYERYLKHVRSR